MKETSDLFDFEATKLKNETFSISPEIKTSYITTINDEINLIKAPQDIPIQNNNLKILSEINFSFSSFSIYSPFMSDNLNEYFEKENCERLWTILPKATSTELKENDIIKLGRVRLKFDKICLDGDNAVQNTSNVNINYTTNYNMAKSSVNGNNNVTSVNVSNYANEVHNSSFTSRSNKNMLDNKICCRICYRNESDLSDPLISPCKCTGSMAFIHYKCLKSCIDSKVTKKEDENYCSYLVKNYNCEICLSQYPKYIKYKSITYFLIDIDTSKYNSYAICDYSLFDDSKGRLFHKGFIIFRLEEGQEVTLGRTQSNKVKLKDISVSRKHCALIKKKDKLHIIDYGSKFGSLLYLKGKMKLEINKNFEVVSGKHFLRFNLERKWSLFSDFFKFGCCNCKHTSDGEEFVMNLEKRTKKPCSDRNDELYTDFILYLSKIYGEEELNSNVINTVVNSFNNVNKKDDSYTN